MATDFNTLRRVPARHKYLVHGYCRELESVLLKVNNHKPYYNMPQLSIFLIISYYTVIEYFDIIESNKVELSNDNQTITKIYNRSWYNTSYGHQIINPSKDKAHYKWVIKIVKLHNTAEIGFGCDFDHPGVEFYLSTPYYGLDCYGGYIEGNGVETIRNRKCIKPSSIKTGDTICLEFNVDGDNSFIKFSKGETGEEAVIYAYEITMNDEYRLAISLADEADSFSIIEFKCT